MARGGATGVVSFDGLGFGGGFVGTVFAGASGFSDNFVGSGDGLEAVALD